MNKDKYQTPGLQFLCWEIILIYLLVSSSKACAKLFYQGEEKKKQNLKQESSSKYTTLNFLMSLNIKKQQCPLIADFLICGECTAPSDLVLTMGGQKGTQYSLLSSHCIVILFPRMASGLVTGRGLLAEEPSPE